MNGRGIPSRGKRIAGKASEMFVFRRAKKRGSRAREEGSERQR